MIKSVSCKNIFLTGVTGVVGGRILYEILACTEAKVYCLVRAEDVQKAKRRIADILAIYDPKNSLHLEFELRVTAIVGDISKPKFGLEPKDYYQLAQQIEQVFHMAANVSLVAGYDKLAKTNLQGTSEVVEFCLAGHIPMLYASSYSVGGSKITESGFVFRETDLDVGQSFEYQNYKLTKMRAEQLIHSAGTRGLKWVIVRLGDIFGDSQTGCYPLTNTTTSGLYYSILKTIVETGFFYFTKDYSYITPVDYAAKSSLYLAFNPEAYSKTFHIVNPDQKYYYDLVNLLVDFGYRIKIIPFQEYISLLKNNVLQKEGKIYSSSFTSLLLFSYFVMGSEFHPDSVVFYTGAEIDTSNTQKFLLKSGISCPNVDIDLISTYLNYCIEQRFIAPPAKQHPLAILKS